MPASLTDLPAICQDFQARCVRLQRRDNKEINDQQVVSKILAKELVMK